VGRADVDDAGPLREDRALDTGIPGVDNRGTVPPGPPVISGTAFDGRHLAVWGGLDSAGHFLDDGAIYDVQTDAWQVMSAGPLTARAHAGVMWSKGALLVGGGLDRLDNPEFLRDLASYDPTHDTWDSLASSPEGGPVANRPNFAEGNEPLLITQTIVTEAVVKPQWFFGDAGWELAPQPDVHSMGEQVIAASNVPFNPGSGNLAVAVRRPDGVWETGRSATFKNRGFAAIATAGGRLYVTTGCEQTGQGFDMRLAEGAWVFDPAQSG